MLQRIPKLGRSLSLLLTAAITLTASLALAQATPLTAHATAVPTLTRLPQFEVASIKPSGPKTLDIGFYTYPGGRVVAHNFTLKNLVMIAFNIQDFQISGGPDWLNDARFDVEAKPPATSKSIQSDPPSFKDPPNPEQREMLQSLLIDRFHFTFHRGTAEGLSYVLTRNGKPLKLHPPKDPKAFSWAGSPEGGGATTSGLAGTNITMAQLATRLSGVLKRPILDQTGLEGAFDFEYKTGSDDSDTDVANAVIHSLQNIGLSLKQTKVPVSSIVIDHAEKPSPN